MVLYRVDKRLRMFDPHAHRKRLGFQTHAPPVQQLVNIPGRMSRSKNHSRSFIKGISDPHPFYAIVVQFDIGNPRIENDDPPASRIVRRILEITLGSLSVPIWGWDS